MLNVFKKLFAVYLSGIVLVSVIPMWGGEQALDQKEFMGLRFDYLLHVLVFLPFAPLWRLGWRGHSMIIVLAAGFFLAAAAEVSHYLLPYRGYNVYDMLGNVVGVLAGGMLFYGAEKLRGRSDFI